MTKSGWWVVRFDLALDGEEVRFEDLSEATQEHIAEMIKQGYHQGEIVEENDDWMDVEGLSAAQFAELRENYWTDIMEEGKYSTPEDVPDQVIFEHYRHTTFNPEDFMM